MPNLTFSSVVRYLRKKNPKKVKNFLKEFNHLFFQAVSMKIENPEAWVLLQIQTTIMPDIINAK